MPQRFNHMELTLPPGRLTETRDEISEFYGDLFGWSTSDIPILGQTGLLIRTDPTASQFILVTEQRVHIDSPGYDHLGLLCDTRDEVDGYLSAAKSRQDDDERVQIKEYEDLVNGDHVTHAFYVKFLLPIWFDVQCFERAGEPQRDPWSYTLG
ncbi:MAG: hypothetical protein AAF548_19110 [Actinomycetota bacterium]